MLNKFQQIEIFEPLKDQNDPKDKEMKQTRLGKVLGSINAKWWKTSII